MFVARWVGWGGGIGMEPGVGREIEYLVVEYGVAGWAVGTIRHKLRVRKTEFIE